MNENQVEMVGDTCVDDVTWLYDWFSHVCQRHGVDLE